MKDRHVAEAFISCLTHLDTFKQVRTHDRHVFDFPTRGQPFLTRSNAVVRERGSLLKKTIEGGGKAETAREGQIID